MRVAIIGCGYVGTALAGELLRRGHTVIGTTTTPGRQADLAALGVTPVVVQLREVERLRVAIADCHSVFCMVAPPQDHRDYRETYLEGIRHLLTAVRDTAVRQIVYTSSTSVYGQDDGSVVDEDSPTEPRTESGRILLAAEQELLAGAAGAGVTATVLRLAGIYGPDRGPARRVVHYAGQERTDGEGWVNLIHRDDIVQACVRLRETPWPGVLLLADDQPVRRREYYDGILRSRNLPAIQWRKPDGPVSLGKRACNARIKRVLHLQLLHPKHSDDGS